MHWVDIKYVYDALCKNECHILSAGPKNEFVLMLKTMVGNTY